jgi:hypothetical protein
MPLRLPFQYVVCVILLLGCWSGAMAQVSGTIRISGNVLNASDKTPLPGVGIFIKGSTTGTVSNEQGQFSTIIPRNDTLVFRMIGFKTVEYVPVIRSLAEVRINIYMEEGSVELQEVEISSRPSQEKIDRYVRNLKRPDPNYSRNPSPVVRVIPDKPLTPLPATIASPISLMYEMFSSEGKQRKRVKELEEQQRLEDEERRRKHFNRFFRDNTGYE